jgi:hypothetical protein
MGLSSWFAYEATTGADGNVPRSPRKPNRTRPHIGPAVERFRDPTGQPSSIPLMYESQSSMGTSGGHVDGPPGRIER